MLVSWSVQLRINHPKIDNQRLQSFQFLDSSIPLGDSSIPYVDLLQELGCYPLGIGSFERLPEFVGNKMKASRETVDGKIYGPITSWYDKSPIILQGFIHPRWLGMGFLPTEKMLPGVDSKNGLTFKLGGQAYPKEALRNRFENPGKSCSKKVGNLHTYQERQQNTNHPTILLEVLMQLRMAFSRRGRFQRSALHCNEMLWYDGKNLSLSGGFKYFFFTPMWGRFPFWLIFFKGVGSTTS